MSYRNSLKLLISNFSTVWKQLLYMLVISTLCFGLAYATLIPTINVLRAEGVLGEFSAIFETIYTAPRDLITACRDAFMHMSNVINANGASLWASILFSILFAYVLFNILKYVSFYNVSYVMQMKMTSFVEVGYTRSLISNFTDALRYAFSRFVYTLPFAILKMLIIFTYLKFATSPLSIILGLFLSSMILIMVYAIEISIFVGHAPTMLEKNGEISAFKAFLQGNKVVFKNYAKVISNSIVVALSIIVLNIFLGVFTIGAGLFITIPMSIVFKSIFELASYLGSKGERYYVAENTIAVSKDHNISKD